MAKLISQRKLNSIKLEWQRKLRLQDWRITIRFADPEELKNWTAIDEACGACRHHEETKQAEILVLDQKYCAEENDERAQDVEDTVIHELLHCHFAVFRNGERAIQLHIEQIIEVMTEALLVEKRGKKRGS